MQVEWVTTAEQRAEIEPHLATALRFLPPWVTDLSVRYDPTLEDLCCIRPSSEYRRGSIIIGNGWFAEDKAPKTTHLIHEVMHLHIERLADAFVDLAKATTEEDSPLRKLANEQWRRAEEGCVTDLSRAIAGAVRQASVGENAGVGSAGPSLADMQFSHEPT